MPSGDGTVLHFFFKPPLKNDIHQHAENMRREIENLTEENNCLKAKRGKGVYRSCIFMKKTSDKKLAFRIREARRILTVGSLVRNSFVDNWKKPHFYWRA